MKRRSFLQTLATLLTATAVDPEKTLEAISAKPDVLYGETRRSAMLLYQEHLRRRQEWKQFWIAFHLEELEADGVGGIEECRLELERRYRIADETARRFGLI